MHSALILSSQATFRVATRLNQIRSCQLSRRKYTTTAFSNTNNNHAGIPIVDARELIEHTRDTPMSDGRQEAISRSLILLINY